MKIKSLIVMGLNPSKSPSRKGSTIPKLHSWMYDSLEVDSFFMSNVSHDPDWDFKYRSIDKNHVIETLRDHDIIIALGSTVYNYLKRMGFKNMFKLPHPSPRNRQLNDKSFEIKILNECKEYLTQEGFYENSNRQSGKINKVWSGVVKHRKKINDGGLDRCTCNL